MARPLKRRRICEMPRIAQFIPSRALPQNPSSHADDAEPVILTVDEYEAIRLIDYLDYSQEECAGRINVARTTIQLIYDSARRKLATALVCGRCLKIEGGVYELCPHSTSCCGKNCHSRQPGMESYDNGCERPPQSPDCCPGFEPVSEASQCGQARTNCQKRLHCQKPPSDS